MSRDIQLARVVKEAANTLHQGEKFPLPVLAVRASKAAEQNPTDVALVTASNVLKKMASDNRLFITRGELNDLYDKLYTPNTKLAELFANEMDRRPLPSPTVMQRAANDSVPLEYDYEQVADPILSNALMAAFDGSNEERIYSSADAKQAERVCQAELSAHGFPPRKVSVFAGRNDIIVCQADYETPKGQAHVLVPVEIKSGSALLPGSFLTSIGFVNMEPEALKAHIISTAGKSFKVDGQKLLTSLAEAKHGPAKELSDVEMAMLKLEAANEEPAYSANGILAQQIEPAQQNVELPKVPLEPEHESFAQRLSSNRGVANYLHGERVVTAGANMLTRKMYDFGFGHAQVGVSDVKDDTIIYSVAVDQSAGFTVPVKVQDGLVMPPSIAMAAGNLSDFSREGISSLVSEGDVDTRAVISASPSYGAKPSELMQQVRDGIAEGNIAKAEDAIDVLGEVDPDAQKRALALLMESFNPETLQKVASEQRGCSMIIKNSKVSKHALCGHLNLPVHKVYQDKNGDCQPLYRRGMEETNDGGATFMFHKILQY